MSGLIQRWGMAAALALPLIGLGAGWAITHSRAQQGEEWLVPVQGYDPRDLLRGHYIQFRYDWPLPPPPKKAEGREGLAIDSFADPIPMELCLEGKAPTITRATRWEGEGSGQRCAIVVKEQLGNRPEISALESGILFVSQTSAAGLEDKLRDPKLQGLIRVKIREDGVMRPVGIEFRPRPAPQS